MRPKTSMGGALDAHSGEKDRITDAQAKYFKVTGEVEITSLSIFSEALVSVNFPVFFTGKPMFSYGFELGSGQPLTAGQLPTGTAVVTQWGQRSDEDGDIIYVGATIAAAVSGIAGYIFTLLWHFEGIGLQGPTPGDG